MSKFKFEDIQGVLKNLASQRDDEDVELVGDDEEPETCPTCGQVKPVED